MASSGSDADTGLTVAMTRNAAGVITSVEDTIVQMLGWQPEQLIGLPSTRFIYPDDQPSAIAAWMEMITAPGATRVWRGRYQSADGSWTWVETVNRLEDSEDPTVRSTMTRVTVEQVSFEEELRAREQLLSRLSDALPVGVFQIDETGQISFTNDQLHAISGVLPVATIGAQLSTVIPEDRPLVEAALAAVLADEPVDDIEIRLRLASDNAPAGNTERVCMLSLRALTDSVGSVTGAIGCLSDVTDRVQLRHELETRATVDKLTSCLNRAATIDLLERTVAASAVSGTGSAVVFIDLDQFKSVNDDFGHAAGDRLLVAAAGRLRRAVRDGDYVGRLGGDEFLVVCPDVETADEAVRISERLAAAMSSSVDVGPTTIELRASVGVAWRADAIDTDSFIAQADAAMYQSKRAGQQGVTLFMATDQADDRVRPRRSRRIRRRSTAS